MRKRVYKDKQDSSLDVNQKVYKTDNVSDLAVRSRNIPWLESLEVKRGIVTVTGKPAVFIKMAQPRTALSVGNYTARPCPVIPEKGRIVLLVSSLQISYWE